MRPASDTDFILPIEGIGTFTFAKKKMRDAVAIECEYARLTEGIDSVTNFLHFVAAAMSSLKVLTVAAPKDWDIDEMDPEDDATYEKLSKVWGALRDKQATFRAGAQVDGEKAGESPVANP